MLIKDLLCFGLQFLHNDSSRIEDINLLIQHIFGFEDYAEIIINSQRVLNDEQMLSFENLLHDLKKNKPIHYITKEKFFYNKKFHINEDCLIPRWDSEEMVKKALELLAKSDLSKEKEIQILDLCSGSGCLGVSLGCELQSQNTNLTMWDSSKKAMEMATLNAKKYNINHQIIISDFLNHDHFSNKKYDIILFNPPYIRSDDVCNLEEKIKFFEPITALDGGKDGLIFYKHIYTVLNRLLNKNGFLVMEHGFDQFDDIKNIFQNDYQVKAFSDLHCVVRHFI